MMAQNQSEKPRILIVDDSPENLHTMMHILRDTYILVTATSGKMALDRAAREPRPDLILLDIKMPGMDGYDVLRLLKANTETSSIPVIFVTSLSEADDEAKGLKLGARDYITKPINPELLRMRILTQLELLRYRRKLMVPPGLMIPDQQPSILVVDDTPENIHQLVDALSGEYRMLIANNGNKAIEIVQSVTPPELILLDIVMPEMDGFEVCRQIKATEVGSRVPIIFLSVVGDPVEKVRGFSIGGADYITKPFDIDEVRARIRAQLELVHLRSNLELMRDAAEAANQAKSLFLANMSHEIRTPLNAILGLTHLLQRKNSDSAQRDRLEKIVDASQHLLAVINDILEFSRIEAGKLDLNITDFAVDRMLDHALSMITPGIQEKKLQIEIIRGEYPQVLVGDSTRLAQALLNYLSNALKFTERGKITVRISMVEDLDNDVVLLFEVQDTGIGIAPDDLDRIFAAFEQVDATTARRFGGSGLGLAITRRLALLMGGDAGVRSTLGQGSCFWFNVRLGKSTLNLQEIAKVQATTQQNGQSMPVGAHILIAEDNKINQDVAVSLLTDVGLHVDVADDGLQAVEKVRSCEYDLILMDVQMPGMDGLEATRTIRQLPDRKRLPIIAMTANAFDDDRRRCQAAGMDDFVPKPVDPERLYQVLASWLPHKGLQIPPPAVAPPPALPERLLKLSGFEAERGLSLLNGHLNNYFALLKRFATERAHDAEQVREKVGRGDYAEAAQLAHTLKGISGNIGATKVQRLAGELEQLIKNDANLTKINHLTDALQAELENLTLGIVAALPRETGPHPATPVDWSEIRRVLDELKPLLAASSTKARRIIEMHGEQLRTILGEQASELESLISHFLFPEALEALNEIQRTHPDLR